MSVSSLSMDVEYNPEKENSHNETVPRGINNCVFFCWIPEIQSCRSGFKDITVLSGRVKPWGYSPVNQKIFNAFLLSNNIVDYVNQNIYSSFNYSNRDGSMLTYKKDHGAALAFIRDPRASTQVGISRSRQCHIGNCFEMSFLALSCPDIQKFALPVEVFEILGRGTTNGDHVFTVVGRDPKTDPRNPSSWNEEAFISDPWAKAFYPASAWKQFLKNYIGIHNPPKEQYPSEYFQGIPIVTDLEPEHYLAIHTDFSSYKPINHSPAQKRDESEVHLYRTGPLGGYKSISFINPGVLQKQSEEKSS